MMMKRTKRADDDEDEKTSVDSILSMKDSPIQDSKVSGQIVAKTEKTSDANARIPSADVEKKESIKETHSEDTPIATPPVKEKKSQSDSKWDVGLSSFMNSMTKGKDGKPMSKGALAHHGPKSQRQKNKEDLSIPRSKGGMKHHGPKTVKGIKGAR